MNQGIQETPMSQISKESGIAIGTIYHHFKSKKEIINYIFLDINKDLGKVQMANVMETSAYKIQFFQIWNNLFAFYAHNEQKFKFLQNIEHLPIIDEEIRQEALKIKIPLNEFYKKGIQAEILKPMNLHILSETLHGNVVSLANLYHQKTIELNKTVLLQAIIMSWESVVNK